MMIAAGRVHTSNGVYLGGDKLVAILTTGSLVTVDVCACIHKVIGQSRVSFLRSFPSCYLDGVSHWPATVYSPRLTDQ